MLCRHQAVVFAVSRTDPEDAALNKRARVMFLLSVLIVLIQCVTMPRLFSGVVAEQCEDQDACSGNGRFCAIKADPSGSRCVYCATQAPLELQWDYSSDGNLRTYNFPEDENFRAEPFSKIGFNTTHVLEVCADPKKSVYISPPPGHGNHPNPPGYRCFDLEGDGPPWERIPSVCPGATVLGEPSPTYEEFVHSWCHRCVDPMTGTSAVCVARARRMCVSA